MAQINTNEPLVENRKKLGRYTSLAGLAIIFGGLVASFQNQFLLAYGALIVGFLLSNFGAYFLSRWGLGTHEKLTTALKGMDKRYRLYNYLLPVPNVLLTPYGVTVFLIKNQEGPIVGDKTGWRQRAGILGGIVRFMRALSAEALGDPPKELEQQKETMKKFIVAALREKDNVPVEGYVVFTNPRVGVTLDDIKTPVIVLNKQPDAIKNALRRDKRAAPLPEGVYDDLVELFEKEAGEKTERAQNEFRFWRR